MRRFVPLLLAITGIVGAATWALGDDDSTEALPTPSGDNCSYLADPGSFLEHNARARRGINERLRILDQDRASNRLQSRAATSSPLPRNNVIDDQIFGKLDALGVAAAPLTTDEEFFRRIQLDLTGRIPSAAEVRAFLADSSAQKRSALIDKLLFSDAYVDKWTMWLGDLMENNVTSVNVTRQISGRNALYKSIWASVLTQPSMKDVVYQVLTATGNSYDELNPAAWILNGNAPGGPIQDTYDMMAYKATKQFLGLGHYDCLMCHSGRGHLDALSLWGKYVSRSDAEGMAAFFARTQFRGYAFPAGTSTAEQQADFYFNSQVISNNNTGTYALPTTFGNRPNRTALNGLRAIAPVYRNGKAPASTGWRNEFAVQLINDPLFAINFVNRVWKEMFNLGLVDAVDSLDPDRLDPANPPGEGWDLQATHPELLVKLAQEWTAKGSRLRDLVKMIAESSAYQLSSRYNGEWKPDYVPLFARHYPRRLSGEEMHDAIAKSTGVFTKYTVQGWGDPVVWAMQLPDTSEPRSNGTTNNFMNLFLRGNRDNVTRSQGSTILQSAALMNDTFVMSKIHVAQSPNLKEISALTKQADQLDAMFLTFIGRMPSEYERTKGLAFLTKAVTAAQKNTALEDLAWALINKLEFQFSY